MLLNSLGEIIYSKNGIIETDTWKTVIDLSPFSNGIYFVCIAGSKNEPLKYKIIKEGK